MKRGCAASVSEFWAREHMSERRVQRVMKMEPWVAFSSCFTTVAKEELWEFKIEVIFLRA